jgi:predicted nucleic-acid-binding protein
MKAVDTNILARFFVDDPDDSEAKRQRPLAVRVMTGRVWIAVSVLLELEWVMRGFYELSGSEVSKVLKALCGMENVSVEDRDRVLTAVEWHGQGMDFADALHLARSSRCESLVTFDRGFHRRAARVAKEVFVELAK